MKMRKLISCALCIMILAFLFTSCCRDCDNIVLPASINGSVAVNYGSASMIFADTTWHDTTNISQVSFSKGINAAAKKQFPIDCEECGDQFTRASLKGFTFGDTALSKSVFYTELLAGGNSFTIKDSASRLLFIERNINAAAKVDSLSINGRIYYHVILLTTLSCTQDSTLSYCKKTIPYFSKLYFAPGVGLIRYEITNHPLHGIVEYDRIR